MGTVTPAASEDVGAVTPAVSEDGHSDATRFLGWARKRQPASEVGRGDATRSDSGAKTLWAATPVLPTVMTRL